jgi:hypothetical protein
VIVLPTVIVEVGLIMLEMEGTALMTVRDSQPLVALLLFASPEYTASKLKVPVEL